MKINVKMTTGEVFTISEAFYGDSGPLKDMKSAQVQMSFILTKMAALGTDQGPTINVQQIVCEWISQD